MLAVPEEIGIQRFAAVRHWDIVTPAGRVAQGHWKNLCCVVTGPAYGATLDLSLGTYDRLDGLPFVVLELPRFDLATRR